MFNTDLNGEMTQFSRHKMYSLFNYCTVYPHVLQGRSSPYCEIVVLHSSRWRHQWIYFRHNAALWSADWGNMQRDTHPFPWPRVSVPVCDCFLMKCTNWSGQTNDAGSGNRSLYVVLLLFCVYSLFPPSLCGENCIQLSIRPDYPPRLVPPSSLLSSTLSSQSYL